MRAPSKYPRHACANLYLPCALQINRLPERVKLETIEEALRGIFAQFGTITDVRLWGSLKRKAQAWLTFDTREAAEKAVKGLDGFEMYGRKIGVQMARAPSDANVRQKGNDDQFEQHKRHRLTLKGMYT